MQQALRPYAVAGIAILGTGSLMAFTPVAPRLPDVHVPAIQLTSDSGLLGDFSSLFGDVTGGTSGVGGLGDLTGDLTGLLSGLIPSSLLSDIPGLASVDPAPADPSLLTPYLDLFTNTFTNLQAIGTEFADVTLPELEAALQAIIANPSLIADLPAALFGVLTDPGSITTSLTTDPTELPIVVDILLGAPLLIGLGEVGPLVTSLGALETVFGELTSGDPTTVLSALIDGPAEIANAMLNGTTTVDLPVLGDLSLFNGLLVPDSFVNVDVGLSTLTNLLTTLSPALGALDPALATVLTTLLDALGPLGSTELADISVGPFGGLIDALVNVIPQELADPASATAGTDLTGLLDPSTLLSGLNLGDLGGLLDPSTLAGDLTTLLPSLASDLPAGLADLATAIPF
jgi:hypothetical protein